MTRRKQRTNWKLAMAFNDLQEAASKILVLSRFSGLLSDGFELQASSGIWEKANGTLTARLVYRNDQANSLVLSMTNIPISVTRPDKPKVANG